MVAVFLAQGFEEVEAFTPLDYLRRCEELDVKTVGVTGKMVTGSHGITTIADLSLEELNLEELEMIILPGGMPGTINLEKSEKVQAIINYCIVNNIVIAAICAAPSILGHKGILNGKKASCYIGFEDELIGATVLNEPVVVDHNIITARGAGVANEFAFALIEKLLSKARAQKVKDSVLWQEK
ncbi:DJ-1/PfpI family protein [Paludicola sp. MB14-C6]|uniref:DJ-1 family glyoxalase III n=1 Tax=Paludihabitans sp. MB14-C6 TaxID=3070656 RepID=UPI0027DC019E|nr:DJ-1 family glyoxalase III [Paludicola sp. MB14-C6]WMJ23436.1 DJ-1/PfpI family protein [Paludicola sp. MB14-C6]